MIKKIFILASVLLFSKISFSQNYPINNRSTGSNTLNDPRLQAGLNFFVPRYADTIAANLQKGIDSCGAIIYVYNTNNYLYRACSPKRWVVVGGRFGVEDNLFTANRAVNMQNFRLNLDSGEVSIRGSFNNPSDSVFMVKKGLVPILRVDNVAGKVNVLEFGAYNNAFIVNGAAAVFQNSYPVLWSSGAYIMPYQQPLKILRSYPKIQVGGTIENVIITNDTLGAKNMDSVDYYPFQIRFRSFVDNIERTRLLIRQDGSIWSNSFPSGLGGSTDSALVVKNGIISSVPYSTFGGSGGSGGLAGGNLGSGFRIYYPPIEGVKTLFNGYAVNIDSSSNANGLTFKVDSFNIATRAKVQKPIDSLGGIIATKGDANANIGSGFRWLLPSSQVIKTVFNSYALTWDSSANVNGLTPTIDTAAMSTRLWRQKGIDSTNSILATKGIANTNIGSGYRILSTPSSQALRTLFAGSNVTIDSTTNSNGLTIHASGDTNWVYLSNYGTPNDGGQDTTAIQAAVATGKNVYVTPGVWEYPGKGNGVVLAKGQIIRGYGLSSIIHFTADTINVFNMSNDTSSIDHVTFIGKGRGSYPGAETFTFSNAIKIGGNGNLVEYCNFFNVKGAAITGWIAASTMYNTQCYFNNFDSCTIGIFLVLNSEYGKYGYNSAQHCRAGFVERCSGNNKWDMINGDYCDYGFRLSSIGGCNGDHGSVSNFTFNHGTGVAQGIYIDGVTNGYVFINGKLYFSGVTIGATDTARQVIFRDIEISTTTITTTKARNCLWTGGSFQPTNSPAVTISGTTGIEFCNIMNSIYQNTTCGGGASLTNPMTGIGDMIIGGVSGTPTRLAPGTDGQILQLVSGSPAWVNASGGGDVFKVGTPVNNQIGVWTGNGTIEGDANFTWDASNFAVTGTASVSTSITSPLIIGTSSTTAGIIVKASTGNASGANPAYTLTAGNNGATQLMRWDHNGTLGIGTNPSSSVKVFIIGLGTSTSTLPLLIRNGSSVNLFQIDDAGNWRLGSQSAASVGMLYYRNAVGTTTAFTPTAWLHIGAGTTAAQTAPIKLTSGTSMTSAEAGSIEFTTDDLFFTITTGTARKRFLFADPTGGLTSGRVPFATTNGRLTDDAGLAFSTSTGLVLTPAALVGPDTTTYKILVRDASGNVRTHNWVTGGAVASITGTANQVLANGTSGSPQTGAITLTLPQSIATSSTVQFGGIGIGASAGGPASNSTINPSVNPGAGSTGTVLGIRGTLVEQSSGTHDQLAALVITAPTITGGAATVTRTASLNITGAPSATVTDRNYAIVVDAGEVYFQGATSYAISTISTTTTLDATHRTVKVDASGGAVTINLPAAAGCQGRIYVIKKVDSSGNSVTADGNASETIDGATTKATSTQYAGFTIQSDGVNWNVIGTF